ncbi:MAG: Coenzyme F420 hydrogenase/dehydrogenase, beta subunit C-terminal domain [Lachnospiraceae bacterium]|nr:Coenzyme F420 hydrogenase/dehydrogenase, beta subunit C-terminal domain [Lachnospiraceae bacterium]
MKEICKIEKCTGCSACMNICPKNAIKMECNQYGVLLPKIDESKCVDCGACDRVCPTKSKVESRNPVKAFAAWSTNENIRKGSSSGGIATVLYDKIVSEGGIAYGAYFDSEFNLKFNSVCSKDKLEKFRGSKYAQAEIGYCFREIKINLEKNRKVIYIGTPCQVAGLRNFLRKDYENLFLIDLICHGVPANKYLKEHIASLAKQKKELPDEVTFRGKYNYRFVLYSKGKIIYNKGKFCDKFFSGFMNGLLSRPSCYQCEYANEKRVSDITIGDFWGLGREEECEYLSDEGISLLLPNTKKGLELIKSIKKNIFIDERRIEEAIHGNAQLQHPSEKHEKYEQFRELYLHYGFEKAITICTKKEIKMEKIRNLFHQMKKPLIMCKKEIYMLLGRKN